MTDPVRSVPPGLCASIDASRPPRVLLIRHSDRPAVIAGDSGFALPLTAAGCARASSLGDLLDLKRGWAVASPLRRCMQTAELVGLKPAPSPLLGAPGPYVVDRDRGGDVFGEHGTPRVVRGQIAGETWGCMRPLNEGAMLLLKWLWQQLEQRGGEGVAVSHDAIVMPTLAWAVQATFEDEWLEPLDGAVLVPGGVVWRGRRYEVAR